jgi:hypothetical protein
MRGKKVSQKMSFFIFTWVARIAHYGGRFQAAPFFVEASLFASPLTQTSV